MLKRTEKGAAMAEDENMVKKVRKEPRITLKELAERGGINNGTERT